MARRFNVQPNPDDACQGKGAPESGGLGQIANDYNAVADHFHRAIEPGQFTRIIKVGHRKYRINVCTSTPGGLAQLDTVRIVESFYVIVTDDCMTILGAKRWRAEVAIG